MPDRAGTAAAGARVRRGCGGGGLCSACASAIDRAAGTKAGAENQWVDGSFMTAASGIMIMSGRCVGMLVQVVYVWVQYLYGAGCAATMPCIQLHQCYAGLLLSICSFSTSCPSRVCMADALLLLAGDWTRWAQVWKALSGPFKLGKAIMLFIDLVSPPPPLFL